MHRIVARAMAASFALSLAALAGNARAALTTSEQAQVDSFVVEAKLASVPRVRALVARPDLSTDEASAALASGVAKAPWSDARTAYLRDLLFVGASQASRPVLAIVVTRAALARADALYLQHSATTDVPPAWAAELARVYAFLDDEVANAQNAPPSREERSGIPTSSYDECAKAIAAHLAAHPQWLKADQSIPQAAIAVRAQAQIALVDMMNETQTKRVDAADKLGLAGPRRALFRETGLLLGDTSQAKPVAIERVRALAARFPGARGGLSAMTFGDVASKLRARGLVLAVKTPLDASAGDGPPLFSDEVDGPSIDASLGEVARAFAALAVHRALDVRPELRAQTQRDVRAANGDLRRLLGFVSEPTPDAALTSAAQLLAVDAKRTIDWAMVRLLGNHPESAAILSDALGALAAYAPANAAPSGVSIPLGVPNGTVANNGSSDTVPATNARLAPAGYVTSFTFAGHTWTIARDDAGVVGAKRDGAPLAFPMLANARLPVTEGTVWAVPGGTFAKLQGEPHAGVAAGPHVRLLGTSAKGFDAIAAPAPSDDAALECDAVVRGEVAFAIRASSGHDAWKGVALVITSGPTVMRASLRAFDDRGHETELAAPVDLPALPSLHVKVVAKGARLDAVVSTVSLTAAIPASIVHGDVALGAKRGGVLDITGWAVRKQ